MLILFLVKCIVVVLGILVSMFYAGLSIKKGEAFSEESHLNDSLVFLSMFGFCGGVFVSCWQFLAAAQSYRIVLDEYRSSFEYDLC